jgi:hypothetical protein
MYDIYDGDVCKNFKWSDGTIFFYQERRYGLMMNIDWFQQFKRRSDYSVGVIYFVLMNLPRKERFRFENIIIAGIIPSMDKEPKLNTFLQPIVDELNILWKGIKLSNSLTSVGLTCVVALLCVACDIPATLKCTMPIMAAPNVINFAKVDLVKKTVLDSTEIIGQSVLDKSTTCT